MKKSSLFESKAKLARFYANSVFRFLDGFDQVDCLSMERTKGSYCVTYVDSKDSPIMSELEEFVHAIIDEDTEVYIETMTLGAFSCVIVDFPK